MLSRFLPVLIAGLSSFSASILTAAEIPPLNALILAAIEKMPAGGGYNATAQATAALRSAVGVRTGNLLIQPEQAQPSYCSGGTYLVFLRACQDLVSRGQLQLSSAALDALLVTGQRDGEGIWGRWNANGPGTARLFHEMKLGRNFTSWEDARPGDFLKIFWNTEIGKLERGHSVVFLGTEREGGVDYVRFWSSNKPDGFGEKRVDRRKVPYAVFSRFERPENLASAAELPKKDPYLASLLTVRSSRPELRAKCGVTD